MPEHGTRFALDIPLLIGLGILCVLGLITLYSANGENINSLFEQGTRIGIALVLLMLVAQIPPLVLARWTPCVYFVGLLLLGIVLLVGISNKGAQRWIDLGLFHFQPSEIMKIGVPMMISWILTRTALPPRALMLALSLLATLVPTALVLVQPDLGTAILLLVGGILVVFLAGLSWKLIIAVFIMMGAAMPVLWNLLLKEYQQRRIITLLDPWADPLGAGYHTIQSIIAVGSGGVHGKGWLAGTQSQLEFIPERNTDFIFAVFAEEFGFLGAVALILLYLFLGFRGLLISFRARASFPRLLGACLSFTFLFHVFVNVGMVIGILPVVGVPLPFISHGGSSMVTLMIGFGMLMGIQRYQKSISL